MTSERQCNKFRIYRIVIRPTAMVVNVGQVHEMRNTSLVSWRKNDTVNMGITLLDHICNDTIQASMNFAPITKKLQEKRLR
ncbi:unnamed protein product [Strongylus vulgaris]|uniref:Uncharacterized protein n=1 Tax=Strongylus vulgaris TaxID=40348 RepID=A0A3P7KHH3_STRVU|nr:unnamed protein product [Strongylus vulgaris]